MSWHTPTITLLKSTFSPSVIHGVNQQLLRQQLNSFSLGRKCSKEGFLGRRERRRAPSVSAVLSFIRRGERRSACKSYCQPSRPSGVNTACVMPRGAMEKLSLWEFWLLRHNASYWEGGESSVYLGAPVLPFPLLPADAQRAALHGAEPHLEKSLCKSSSL